jgi:lipid-A-disaccharide synthase-like uncharacterized protein
MMTIYLAMVIISLITFITLVTLEMKQQKEMTFWDTTLLSIPLIICFIPIINSIFVFIGGIMAFNKLYDIFVIMNTSNAKI